MRRNMGGGSFVCGLKRNFSQHTTVEVQAMAGLSRKPVHRMQVFAILTAPKLESTIDTLDRNRSQA